MSEYLAHSQNETGAAHYLAQHLRTTAAIAREFYTDTHLANLAELAGLLHDFGKYQPEFQYYLSKDGKAEKAPHAIWGAQLLGKIKLLAFVIYGHHSGLHNCTDLDTALISDNEMKEKIKALFDKYEKDAQITQNDLLKLVNMGKKNLAELSALEREVVIRLVFSALVDADWLDTENHFTPQKTIARIAAPFPINDYEIKLLQHFSDLQKTAPYDTTPVNPLREAARQQALAKANLPLGFYSLNLPTGLGKTLTSFHWALAHAKAHNLQRIIIVLPYVSIIDQTAEKLKAIIGDENVLEHHSNYIFNAEENETDNNQKKLATENWNYPVIVTTSVQFFESLFSNKPFKCRKNHSLWQSVVIFDEIQTLPAELMQATLEMLKNWQRLIPISFLFCTATLPALEKRHKFNGIENLVSLIDDPALLFAQTQRVKYCQVNELNNSELSDLANTVQDNNRAALIIFNTKNAVREFYNLMKDANFTHIYCLSTNMCPHHRKLLIENIRNDLNIARKILVISTPLVEAGVDFDFPTVYRELAPLESIIQAAGRCNREGLREISAVYLFKLNNAKFPDKKYKTNAQHTELLLQNFSRLNDFAFYPEYYAQIIDLFTKQDDITPERIHFNFQNVANKYRLIDDNTQPIFVANYNEKSKTLYVEIEKAEFIDRKKWQEIQQYSVNVYPNFFTVAKSDCQNLPNGVIIYTGNYSEKIGLDYKNENLDFLMT